MTRLRDELVRPSRLPGGGALFAAAGLATVAVCLLLMEPLGPATNDNDSAFSVLYFQYISSGHRLEAFADTVPKPLLTVVYGLTWQFTHDWRVLVWETITVFAVAVSLAARLMDRLGGLAAAGFVVVALIAWPDLLTQVAHANSFPWALAGWLAAGLAWMGDRRHPWLAGAALLLAGLARPETIWLVAAGVIGTGVLAVRATRDGRWDLVRQALQTVGLGGLAVPALCLHDWLLSGQPLYWATVQANYTALIYPGSTPTGFRDFWSQFVWPRYSAMLPAVLLAVVGLAKLAADRRWSVFGGLALLPTGVIATLAILARRGYYISDRYWAEADAPILLAAAVGAGFLFGLVVNASRSRPPGDLPAPRSRALILLASGSLLSLALAWPALRGTDIQGPLSATRAASAHLASVSARLGPILGGASGRVISIPDVSMPVVDTASVRLFAPRPDLPRIAVEAGVPFSALGDNYLAFRSAQPGDVVAPGQWVLHETVADGANLELPAFEVSSPTRLGRVVLVPIVADAEAGVWLLRVDPWS